MKVSRAIANQIFIALSCTTAPSWGDTRMNGQLMKIGNLVTPETNLGELDPTLRQMLTAIGDGTGVSLEAEVNPAPVAPVATPPAAVAPAATPTPAPAPAPVAPAAIAQAEANGAQAAADIVTAPAAVAPAATKPKRERKKKVADATTPTATQDAVVAAATVPKVPAQPAAPVEPRGPWDIKAQGVRADSTNRGFTAGLVIAQYGLEAGVGAEQAKLYETINGLSESGQTRFNLANSWHMINGYLEGQRRLAAGLDVVTGQPKASA